MPVAEKKPKDASEKEALLSKILDKYKVAPKFPGHTDDKIAFSREYKIFKKEEVESRRKTTYEKLCETSEKIVKIVPDPIMKVKLEAAIRFTGLNVTPVGLQVLQCFRDYSFFSHLFFRSSFQSRLFSNS